MELRLIYIISLCQCDLMDSYQGLLGHTIRSLHELGIFQIQDESPAYQTSSGRLEFDTQRLPCIPGLRVLQCVK
jgi:hypothetical protein